MAHSSTFVEVRAIPVNMPEDDDTIREGLASLFLWWYGSTPPIMTCLRRGWRSEGHLAASQESELLPAELDRAWRQRWFAKDDRTAKVDRYAREQFEGLLNEVSSWRLLEADVERLPLWERLALIILLDQLPRSIYRGTPMAYSYDSTALPLALAIAQDEGAIASLPLHFLSTVFICICHSEAMEHQELLKQRLRSSAFTRRYRTGSTAAIASALDEIQRKHLMRCSLFGRFPERNAVLGRSSTEAESAWLQQLS